MGLNPEKEILTYAFFKRGTTNLSKKNPKRKKKEVKNLSKKSYPPGEGRRVSLRGNGPSTHRLPERAPKKRR